LAVGDECEIDELSERLTELAYSRVDMVSKRGEFAVRGGIVDIFPATAERALRVEFFGDEVDEIREFSVSDQRSVPADEDDEPAETVPSAADMLEKIAGGAAVEGMESLSAVLADGMEPIIALLPAESKIIITEPERVSARAADLVETCGNKFLKRTTNMCN